MPLVKSPRHGTNDSVNVTVLLVIALMIELFLRNADALMFYMPVYYLLSS